MRGQRVYFIQEDFYFKSINFQDITILPVAGSGTLSGFMPLSVQIASITNLTPEGGFFMVFTTVISCGVSVFKAARAASRMGIASPNSLSHSSLIALAAPACSFATASSALTI